jgi:hypothetical protein
MNEPNKEKISLNFMLNLATRHAAKYFYRQAFLLLRPFLKYTAKLSIEVRRQSVQVVRIKKIVTAR